ncbi:MAG: anti-sigma factor family protein [Tagaea sp.]
MDRQWDIELAMRYADGAADAAEAARVEAEMTRDPDLAACVEAMRQSAALARGALNGVLHEEVPRRLIDAIRAAPGPAPAIDDETLMAWCDGELAPAAAARVGQAVARDAKLAARATAFRRTAELARGALAPVLAEPIPQRLIDAVRAEPAKSAEIVTLRPRAVPRRTLAWALAASVAFVAVLGAGGVFTGRIAAPEGLHFASTSDRWLDNVAGFYELYSSTQAREGRLLVDFGPEDVPQLAEWFGARLNRTLAVPDLTAHGFALQGGRMVVIGGRPAAQLLYANGAGELVGLAIAFSTAGERAARAARRGEVDIVHWHRNGYGYAFAGRIGAERLRTLADRAWSDLESI